jgi:ribose-phosphate pyrophosphokinase
MNYKIFSIDDSDLAERIVSIICSDTNSNDCNLGTLKIDTFSDGEISPQFMESIRDKKVFLVLSTTSPEKIVTLLLSIDAAKRASASEVILVIPYFGYSRQDRKEGLRGAIGAKLMADLLQTAGADRIIALDLHAEQIQGFFDIPVNMIPGHIAFSSFIKSLGPDDYCICSPDAGGVKRASKFHQKFLYKFPGTHFAMLSKLRDKPNSIERMDLIGDVKDRHVILVDDMIDTGGTLINAARLLKEGGAKYVTAVISHGVLSGKGHERIAVSTDLDQLIITDSIKQIENPKIQVVSCAKSIARAIEAIVNSISMDSHLEKI